MRSYAEILNQQPTPGGFLAETPKAKEIGMTSKTIEILTEEQKKARSLSFDPEAVIAEIKAKVFGCDEIIEQAVTMIHDYLGREDSDKPLVLMFTGAPCSCKSKLASLIAYRCFEHYGSIQLFENCKSDFDNEFKKDISGSRVVVIDDLQDADKVEIECFERVLLTGSYRYKENQYFMKEGDVCYGGEIAKVANLKKTVFILTTNHQHEFLTNLFSVIPDAKELAWSARELINNKFDSNLLDEVFCFKPVAEIFLPNLFRRELALAVDSCVKFIVDDEAVFEIIRRCGASLINVQDFAYRIAAHVDSLAREGVKDIKVHINPTSNVLEVVGVTA